MPSAFQRIQAWFQGEAFQTDRQLLFGRGAVLGELLLQRVRFFAILLLCRHGSTTFPGVIAGSTRGEAVVGRAGVHQKESDENGSAGGSIGADHTAGYRWQRFIRRTGPGQSVRPDRDRQHCHGNQWD